MKKMIIWVVMQFLYRGMKVLYHDDDRIKEDIDGWKQDKVIQLNVINGPSITIQYRYQQGLYKVKNMPPDLCITFKSITTTFLVFTGQMSVKTAYLQHRFSLKGDVNESMRFVRCVDLVETYLFPRFMTKRILNHQEKKRKLTLLIYIKTLFC